MCTIAISYGNTCGNSSVGRAILEDAPSVEVGRRQNPIDHPERCKQSGKPIRSAARWQTATGLRESEKVCYPSKERCRSFGRFALVKALCQSGCLSSLNLKSAVFAFWQAAQAEAGPNSVRRAPQAYPLSMSAGLSRAALLVSTKTAAA